MPALPQQQQPGAPAVAARDSTESQLSLHQLIAGAAGRLFPSSLETRSAAPLSPPSSLSALQARHDDSPSNALSLSTHNAASPLLSRQTVNTIVPLWYKIDGPGPGAVVGIVLGSVAAFLLIAILISSATGNGFSVDYGEEEIVVRPSPRSRRSSGTHHSSSRPEVRQYSRSPRRETIIVEERRRRSSLSPPPRPRPRSGTRSSIIVEERGERRYSGDDIVEVIEEGSIVSGPPRRQRRKSYNRDDYGRRY